MSQPGARAPRDRVRPRASRADPSSLGRADPLPEGLVQLDRYLAGLGLDRGTLVLFDRRSNRPALEARIESFEAITPDGRRAVVWRL